MDQQALAGEWTAIPFRAGQGGEIGGEFGMAAAPFGVGEAAREVAGEQPGDCAVPPARRGRSENSFKFKKTS